MMVKPIILDALGTVFKGLVKRLEELVIGRQAETLEQPKKELGREIGGTGDQRKN